MNADFKQEARATVDEAIRKGWITPAPPKTTTYEDLRREARNVCMKNLRAKKRLERIGL